MEILQLQDRVKTKDIMLYKKEQNPIFLEEISKEELQKYVQRVIDGTDEMETKQENATLRLKNARLENDQKFKGASLNDFVEMYVQKRDLTEEEHV